MSAANFLGKVKEGNTLLAKVEKLWPKMYKDLAWPISQLPAEMPEEIDSQDALIRFFSDHVAATAYRYSMMPPSQFSQALAIYTKFFDILDIDVHIVKIFRDVFENRSKLSVQVKKLIKNGSETCPCCGRVLTQTARGVVVVNEQRYCQNCLESIFYESRKSNGRKLNAFKKALLIYLKHSWNRLEDQNWHSGVLTPEEVIGLSALRNYFGFKYGIVGRSGGGKKSTVRQKIEEKTCPLCSTKIAAADTSALIIDGTSYHESCLHKEIKNNPQGELTKTLRKRREHLKRNINRRKTLETTSEENNTAYNLDKIFSHFIKSK